MAGRPPAYQPEYAKIAEVLCRLGAIDNDIADALGVSRQSIAVWKKKHPDFLEALGAKNEADDNVERALYERATGFVASDKEYPPDVTACIFWLKNRRKDRWRNDPEGGGSPHPITINLVEPDKAH